MRSNTASTQLDHAVLSLKVVPGLELRMNVVKCAACGAKMRRNGKTKAGRTRWRCESCGASTTGRADNSAKRLDEFLGWLLSKQRQADMPGAGRTFRRRTAEFWRLWPLPPVTGEVWGYRTKSVRF